MSSENYTLPVLVILSSSGAFFIPKQRALAIKKVIDRCENLQTWGEFRHYSPPGVWQVCFDREFEHRDGYDVEIPAGKDFESLEDDENWRSFNINYCIGNYVIAMHKLHGKRQKYDRWIPENLLTISTLNTFSYIENSGGVYLERNEVHAQEIIAKLNASGFNCISVESAILSRICENIYFASLEERRWRIAKSIDTSYTVDDRDIPLVYHTPAIVQRDNPYILALDQNVEWLRTTEVLMKSKFHQMILPFLTDSKLESSFDRLFHQHGFFSPRFFFIKHQSQVVAKLLNSGVKPIDYFQQYYIDLLGRPINVEIKSDLGRAIGIILDYLIRFYLYSKINNALVIEEMSKWMESAGEFRPCTLCGRPFNLLELPDWVYCGSDGISECCFLCEIMEWLDKETTLGRIKDFVDLCGFIPNASISLTDRSFMTQINKSMWQEIFRGFARMGRPKHVKNLFGSWFEGLYFAGALPDGVQVTSRGVRCVAADGHICLSLAEQVIDNWLYKHGIPHIREPKYPYHSELNTNGLRRADWQVQDIFIEFFGLSGDDKYDKKTNEKLRLAQESEIHLIPIFPSDLGELDRVLDESR